MLLLKFYFKKFVETDIHLKLDFDVFLLKSASYAFLKLRRQL